MTPTTQAEADALRGDADTTTQIRLLDPNVVAPAFQQLQQNKQYYNFGNTLQVDRYRVGDEIRDTVIAVRELNLDGISAANRNWVNDTTVYTHGFGVVAAYGNRVNLDGQPTFWEGGIPSSGDMRRLRAARLLWPEAAHVLDRWRAQGHHAVGARLPGRHVGQRARSTPHTRATAARGSAASSRS